MLKNTGRDYELLVMLILKQAQEQDGARNLRVEHNVTLQGLSLTHQIDVYITFDVGGITYATVVQCKDWNSHVKQEQMQTFSQVLTDLPGQPRGVFITRRGFQSGARKLAEDKGIILYTLREPTEQDWRDLAIIRRVVFDLTIFAPRTTNPRLVFDDVWWQAECRRLGVQPSETISLHGNAPDNEVALYDEDKTPRLTLYDFKSALPPAGQEVALQCVIHNFVEPTYIRVDGDPRIPFFRLKSISYEVEVSAHILRRVVEVQADDIAAYIMTDVRSGRTRFVDRELRLRVLRDGEAL